MFCVKLLILFIVVGVFIFKIKIVIVMVKIVLLSVLKCFLNFCIYIFFLIYYGILIGKKLL